METTKKFSFKKIWWLALAGVIILLGLGIYLINENYSISSLVDLNLSLKNITGQSTSTVPVKINESTVKEGEFTGYYQQLDRGDIGVCSYLVVQSGDQALTDYFGKMADDGNTINLRNDSGQLMLDIDLKDVGSVDGPKIASSTPNKPVTLLMRKQAQQPTNPDSCYSFFRILQVR
jgi:hypothetical protein